jgi:hypothetical protein
VTSTTATPSPSTQASQRRCTHVCTLQMACIAAMLQCMWCLNFGEPAGMFRTN